MSEMSGEKAELLGFPKMTGYSMGPSVTFQRLEYDSENKSVHFSPERGSVLTEAEAQIVLLQNIADGIDALNRYAPKLISRLEDILANQSRTW